MFNKLLIALGLRKKPVPKEIVLPTRASMLLPKAVKVARAVPPRPVTASKPYVAPATVVAPRKPEPDTTVEDLATAALLYSMLNSSSSSSRSDPEPEPFRGGGGESGGGGASGSWDSSSNNSSSSSSSSSDYSSCDSSSDSSSSSSSD